MRYIQTRPYGAIRGLSRIQHLIDRAKDESEVKIWYVLGLGKNSKLECLIILPESTITYEYLFQEQITFLTNVVIEFTDVTGEVVRYHDELGNSLPGVVDGHDSQNDHYLFEDHDLAEDYLRFASTHPTAILGNEADQIIRDIAESLYDIIDQLKY